MITLKRRIARDDRTETWFAKDGERALIVERVLVDPQSPELKQVPALLSAFGRGRHRGIERALAATHSPPTFVFSAPEGTTVEDLVLMAGGSVPEEIALAIGASVAAGLVGLDAEVGPSRPRLPLPLSQIRLDPRRGAELRDPAFLAVLFALRGGPRGEERRFAAPELLAGRPADGRAEVYALATIIHRLLTEEHPSGPALATELPAEVRALLEPALALEPNRRPSLLAFQADLERFTDSETESQQALRTWLTEVSQSRVAELPEAAEREEATPLAGRSPAPRRKTVALEEDQSLEAWEDGPDTSRGGAPSAGLKSPVGASAATPSDTEDGAAVVGGDEDVSGGAIASSASYDPMLGLILHGYQLEARLGVGTYARVYRAKHLHLPKVAAIKLLQAQLGGSKTARRRMVREAAALAQLEHPNIVRILDFGFAPSGLPFLVTELVQGPTLSEAIGSGRLTAMQAARVGAQIARGLEAAHARGIVHRDLKPGNVMLPLGPNGSEAKVLDFGMARLSDGPTRITKAGSLVGTPLYMAPEQIRGASEVGPAADLYSLGALLFAAVSGQPPFRGTTLEVISAQLEQAPPLLPALGGLELLVARLLEKDPARRPASAARVAEELERLAGIGQKAPPPRWGRVEAISAVILSLLALAAAIASR